jgi:dihydroorotase-like cyclic amidohydrolase
LPNLVVAGHLVLSGRERAPDEPHVAGSRIVAVEHKSTPGSRRARRIDARRAFVLPRVIDWHAHSGSHPGDGIAALARAAAAGGLTTVVDMSCDANAPVRRELGARRQGHPGPAKGARRRPESSLVAHEASLHPYRAMTPGGRVTTVISRGEVVYDGSTVTAEPGWVKVVLGRRAAGNGAAGGGRADG